MNASSQSGLGVLEVVKTEAVPERNAMRVFFSDGSQSLTWWKWKWLLKCDQLDGEEPQLSASQKAALAKHLPNDIVN